MVKEKNTVGLSRDYIIHPGETLAEVLEEYGVYPSIKWPNDIQINGKKISGILAEGVMDADKLKGKMGFLVHGKLVSGCKVNTSIGFFWHQFVLE